jgi:crossover junction endodeoxyribonuclease RusA
VNYDFFLGFPPTVNNYYVKTQRGVFISQKGRKYREAVAEAINGQMAGLYIQDKILVEVILYPPDNRKRDLDNYMKSLLDALTQSGLWEDDSLIDQLFVYRGVKVSPSGSVTVSIKEAAPLIPVGYTL